MRCDECGAELGEAESCLDRVHALLGAEQERPELARMHGLTVLTYHLQHPSRTKPWYPVAGYEAMRRIFGQGQDWTQVLGEWRRQGAVDRLKVAAGPARRQEFLTGPIPGEATVADVDPTAPAGQADRVLAWARSVAESRVLGDRSGVGRNPAAEEARRAG